MWLFILLNIVLLSITLFWIVREILFLLRTRSCHLELTGTVSSLVEKKRLRWGSLFSPVAKFSVEGTEYSAQIFHYFAYSEFRVGDEIELLAEEAHPERAILVGERKKAVAHIFWYSLLLLAIAVLFAGNWNRFLV